MNLRFLPMLVLGLVACATTSGRKIIAPEYDGVVIHETTGADLVAKFGEPNLQSEQRMTEGDYDNKKFPDCGKTGERLTWYRYSYSEGSMSSYRSESKDFVLDGSGKVCNKLSSASQQKVN